MHDPSDFTVLGKDVEFQMAGFGFFLRCFMMRCYLFPLIRMDDIQEKPRVEDPIEGKPFIIWDIIKNNATTDKISDNKARANLGHGCILEHNQMAMAAQFGK